MPGFMLELNQDPEFTARKPWTKLSVCASLSFKTEDTLLSKFGAFLAVPILDTIHGIRLIVYQPDPWTWILIWDRI